MERDSSCWDTLPAELQSMIWMLLPPRTLFRCLSVCHSWNQAQCLADAHDSFWRLYFVWYASVSNGEGGKKQKLMSTSSTYGEPKPDPTTSWKAIVQETAAAEPLLREVILT